MAYCRKCGQELIMKECGLEGEVPFCPVCNEYRFELYSSAISTVLLNPSKDKVLLIQQYGRKNNILVAGYINKGENAKEALIREVKEEIGLEVVDFLYNDNEYFERSETLMHNYIAVASSEDFILTDEVDQANWFSLSKAVEEIMPDSLAKRFLIKAFDKINEKTFG